MIIESQEQLQILFENIKYTWIIVPIWKDIKYHPALNSLCLLYVYLVETEEYFIIPIDHFDQLTKFENINQIFEGENIKYVIDKKSLLYQFPNQKQTYDILLKNYLILNENLILETQTSCHSFYYQKFHQLNNLNYVVPITKHIEYCNNIKDEILDIVLSPTPNSYSNYNNIVLQTLYNIEKNGLYINKKEFKEFYPHKLISSDYLYSQYGIFTSTGRPSNKYGGINFAALNKENGVRKIFTSRFNDNGILIEFDFEAYHLQLIANEIEFKFPTGTNIHTYLGQQYFGKNDLSEDEYKQSKMISFRLLYGGIDKEFEKIDFFYEVNQYINKFFGTLNKNNYIYTEIFKRKFSKDHVEDFNKYKAWNYFIQLMETENSISLLYKLINQISEFKSKIIMYTYDSFLFDVYLPEKEELIKIVKKIMEGHNFHLKVKQGINYHIIK